MNKSLYYKCTTLAMLIIFSTRVFASCEGFQKIPVDGHHNYSIEVSGDMYIGDNRNNSAPSIIIYYDDNYQTMWRTVRRGERISFRQMNWPYIYAGIPRHNPHKASRIRGGFRLHISSRDGGTNKTVRLSESACTSILE